MAGRPQSRRIGLTLAIYEHLFDCTASTIATVAGLFRLTTEEAETQLRYLVDGELVQQFGEFWVWAKLEE